MTRIPARNVGLTVFRSMTMFIVSLKFTRKTAPAAELRRRHRAWIERGIDAGVFVLAGALESGEGGIILARDTSRAALRRRLAQDPFVAKNVVTVEILEVSPVFAVEPLRFLLPKETA